MSYSIPYPDFIGVFDVLDIPRDRWERTIRKVGFILDIVGRYATTELSAAARRNALAAKGG